MTLIFTDFDPRESATSALSAFYSTTRVNLPNLRYQRSIFAISVLFLNKQP